LPTVNAKFEEQSLTEMQLELNAKYTVAFDRGCVQRLAGTSSYCKSAPTLVTTNLDSNELTGVYPDYSNHTQAGFKTDGRIVYGNFTVQLADLSTGDYFNNFVFVANEILEDAWSYNLAVGAGDMALDINSTIISNTQLDGFAGVLLQSGPVVDQTFAGGQVINTDN
jgi:hypothetical protein